MKNLFKSVVAAIAIIFSGTIQSQTKSPKLENSLLWEVSGNGLLKPSYLFGTVHMICEKEYTLRPKVKEAFAKTTRLALEIDITNPEEMAYMQKSAMGTELLSNKLSSSQLATLENILQKEAGMSVKQIDNYTLVTVMSLLSIKSFGCPDFKMYEMELAALAKEDKKTVMGLETIKDQMEFLDKSFSDAQMLEFFKFINEAETQKLVQNYVSENLSGIYKDVTDEKVMDANAKKWMLDIRNANWVKKMPELMKTESVFFAVGAGHLAGELGVISLLRKAGYTVKPILN